MVLLAEAAAIMADIEGSGCEAAWNGTGSDYCELIDLQEPADPTGRPSILPGRSRAGSRHKSENQPEAALLTR